ncbi:MAG: YfgM family protein [Pseudomonadota bacterium]
MAALDLQEQEQLEALKDWWKDNGNLVLGALLAFTVAVGGWRGWHYYQDQQARAAVTLYEQFIQQVDSRDPKRINDAATAMMEKFPSSIYAARATLMAAQINAPGGDVSRAKTQFQWVIDHAAEASLKDVARLHYATLELDQKNYAGAIKLLDAQHAAPFDGLYADLKGDVLAAMGKTEEARAAYKLAYDKVSAGSMYRGLLEMKIDALGVQP